MAARKWIDAAMLMPVIEVCGCTCSLCAEAIAAMRRHSVMPPLLERSGWITSTLFSSIRRENSKRVKWFSPAASGTVPKLRAVA